MQAEYNKPTFVLGTLYVMCCQMKPMVNSVICLTVRKLADLRD